jgi:hypothetical protein
MSVAFPIVSGDGPEEGGTLDAHIRPGLAPGDTCPVWCRKDHAEDDHPDDRHHQSAAELVAVVTGSPMLEPDELARPASAVARLVRRTGSDLTWVEVVSEEGPEVRLVVTVESARRLVATLSRLLALAVVRGE